MRRVALTVVAIAALVALAPGAEAAGLALASQHTTFGTGGGEPAPASLTNMSVGGSGSSATIMLDGGGGLITTFNNGFLSAWSGDTGAFDVIGSPSPRGGTALEGSTTGGAAQRITSQPGDGLPQYVSKGSSVSYYAQMSDGGKATFLFAVNGSGDYLALEIDDDSEELRLNEYTGGSFDSVLASSAAAIPSNEWLRVELDYASNGDVVAELNDGGTQIATLGPQPTSETGTGIGFEVNAPSGSATAVFDEVSSGEIPNTAQYVGAAHDTTAEQAYVDITTLSDAEATVTWQEDADGDGSWTDVASTTVPTPQNVTTDLSGTTADRWRVVVDVTTTSDTATAEIDAEGLLFDPSAPAGSSPSPTGQIESFDGDAELSISDDDFGTPQGDSVNVSVARGGSTLNSTTVTSNGTVSLRVSALAGTNDLTWTLSDSYGETTTVSQTFSTPADLRIVNATSPDQLITGQSNRVTVRFFDGSDVVRQRNTTDGTISLAGLPASPDGGYSVTVTPEQDFVSREVVIRSLFRQQTVYVLPTDEPASTVEFQLTDRTGRFSQPRLTVLRPVTRDFDDDNSNETRYVAALSAQFSAAQSLTTTLDRGTRYRLRVRNENGATRVLGSFTPQTTTDVVDLTIAQISLGAAETDEPIVADAEIREVRGQRALRFIFEDGAGSTSTLNYEVKRVDTDPNVSITNGSAADLGRTVATFDVSQYPENASFAVVYNYSRDGTAQTGLERAGTLPPLGIKFLGGQVASLTGWLTIVSLTGLVVIRSPRLAAVVCVALTSALSVLEVVAVGLVPLGIASAIALLFVISRGVGQ